MRVSTSCLLLLISLPAVVRAADGAAPAAALSRNSLNPAETCGICHADIYKAWHDSVHARSFTGPIFQAALEKVVGSEGKESRHICLSCHAPAVLVNSDYEAREAVTREGIGCDFCHSVKSVDLDRRTNPFEIELGGVKRGPFEYLESPAHETAYSPLHRNSPLLCAACHEYKNEAGAKVLATYSEWSEGPYPARGVSCQSCHMAIVPGLRVQPGIAAPQQQRIINLHRLVGGSSMSQLRRGIEASLGEVRREGGGVLVKIEVRNVAAGHKVPTGLPTKQMKLVVRASQGGKDVFSAERVYSRVLVDKNGKEAKTDEQVFFNSARVLNDTRLKPGENRVELFRFSAPPGELTLSAELRYQYRPFEVGEPVDEVIQKLEGKVPR
jgi:hypothetical protein